MKFLVTGGAGFIGLNYLYLMQKSHPEDEYICLDILSYASSYKHLEPLLSSPTFRFLEGDIADRSSLYSLFKRERFDIVINFAAETHVDKSIEDPSIFLHSNVMGVSSLLDACFKYPVKRFHQVSTDEVYGNSSFSSSIPFKEDDPLNPSSPYSASKASADLLVMAYRRTYGIPVSISRSSNNYGRFQHEEKLIPSFILKAKENKKLPLYGDGRNIRDWIYVEDNCKAIDLIVRNGKEGEIYNVSSSNERSNIEVAESILKAVSRSESLLSFAPDRKGHDLRYFISSDKIKKELGWRPETPFEEGLKETIGFYLRNDE